jgi:type IV pilus assembly protein PilW
MNALSPRRSAPRPGARQRGLTLIEILVAMAIAIFLLGGLFTIVQNTRRSFGAQAQMAMLQDNERLAMTLIGDVIQQAGYFPDPTTYTSAGTLPVTGVFTTAGQSVFGTSGAVAPAPGDSITVRFTIAPTDGLINCSGNTNTGAANVTYVNTFVVDPTPPGYLSCTLNDGVTTTTYQLVSGVQNLSILYGVKTNFSVDNGAVDSYLRANQMTALNWNNVIAVRITLTFVNPLAGQPNQPATIPIQRVVAVMNRAGVKT